MENLTDWKGNIIKAGDVLVKVRIKKQKSQLVFDINAAELSYSKNEISISEFVSRVQEINDKFIETPSYMWEPISEHTVQESESTGNLFIQTKYSEYRSTESLFIFLNGSVHPKEETVCIKGLSDNETEFYLHYFNL